MNIAATSACLVKFLCRISSNQLDGCMKSIFDFQFYFCIINEELNDLYSSPNIVQVINKMSGACSMYGDQERGIHGFGAET